MTNDRLNKGVFEWSVSNARTSYKNWVYIVKNHFQSLRCGAYAELNNVFSKSSLVQDVSNAIQTNSRTGNINLEPIDFLRHNMERKDIVSYCFALNIDQFSLSSEWELHPLILKLADIGI